MYPSGWANVVERPSSVDFDRRIPKISQFGDCDPRVTDDLREGLRPNQSFSTMCVIQYHHSVRRIPDPDTPPRVPRASVDHRTQSLGPKQSFSMI
jgi:hypothetical protein